MKTISRRKFLQISGLAAGASMMPMPVKWLGAGKADAAFNQTKGVPLYGTNLRALEIPVAWPDNAPFAYPIPMSVPPAPVTGVRHYTANLIQYKDPGVVPTLGPTTLWGYKHQTTLQGLLAGKQPPMRHLGGIMIAEKDVPVQLTLINDLPLKHIIPNDLTIPGANLGDDRTVVHFHGGSFPWVCDGGPFDWFCSTQRLPANRACGESFANNAVLNPTVYNDVVDPTKKFTQGEYYWNFNQSARLVWYHDHAWGITRINAYAGVASAIILRDNFERGLMALGMPPLLEASLVFPGTFGTIREFPLVFQDKIFVTNTTCTTDPIWKSVSTATTPGSLWYPHIYEPGRWRKVYSSRKLPNASVIPEMFGDTMLVNGTAFPKFTVEARRYRFRLLNACNARFLNLQMYIASATLTPAMALRIPAGEAAIEAGGMWISNVTGVPLNEPALNNAIQDATGAVIPSPQFLQLGVECGFFTNAIGVPSAKPFSELPDFSDNIGTDPVTGTVRHTGTSLLIGCAERPDIIWDFKLYAPVTGQPPTEIILYNDCPGPFPGSAGDPRNDYFPGLKNGNAANVTPYALNPATKNSAPNSRIFMKFIVGAAQGVDSPLAIYPGMSLEALGTATVPWGEERLIDQNLAGTYVPTARGTAQPFVPAFPGATYTHQLSLNEEFDSYGRLQQLVTNTGLTIGPGAITAYSDPPDLLIQDKTTEIWEIQNNTADVHPMHFHMLNAQIINRETISVNPPVINGPLPDEYGWKETIKMWPGTITRFVFHMDSPLVLDNAGAPAQNAPFLVDGKVVNSNRFPNYQYQETVWHCHILEHEEHDMMRPIYINVPGAPTVPYNTPLQ